MYQVEGLWISQYEFFRRFRRDDDGWIYDPSLGRAEGKQVTSAVRGWALQNFFDLHGILAKRINVCAKFFIVGVFLVTIAFLYLGGPLAGLYALYTQLALMLGMLLHANWRLLRFTRQFWHSLRDRPNSRRLSEAERIALGYRMSWTSRIAVFLGVVILGPAYVSVHQRENLIRKFPGFEGQLGYYYWAGIGAIVVMAMVWMIARKIWNKAGLAPISWRPTMRIRKPAGRKEAIKPHPRGNLSGLPKPPGISR